MLKRDVRAYSLISYYVFNASNTVSEGTMNAAHGSNWSRVKVAAAQHKQRRNKFTQTWDVRVAATQHGAAFIERVDVGEQLSVGNQPTCCLALELKRSSAFGRMASEWDRSGLETDRSVLRLPPGTFGVSGSNVRSELRGGAGLQTDVWGGPQAGGKYVAF